MVGDVFADWLRLTRLAGGAGLRTASDRMMMAPARLSDLERAYARPTDEEWDTIRRHLAPSLPREVESTLDELRKLPAVPRENRRSEGAFASAGHDDSHPACPCPECAYIRGE